jgi:hypothetical protein
MGCATMPPMANRGSVAPRPLDPLLALVERIDRRLRGIRPVRHAATS